MIKKEYVHNSLIKVWFFQLKFNNEVWWSNKNVEAQISQKEAHEGLVQKYASMNLT